MPIFVPPGSTSQGVTGDALARIAALRMKAAEDSAASDERFGEQMGGAVADVGKSVYDAEVELDRNRRQAARDKALMDREDARQKAIQDRQDQRQKEILNRQQEAEDFHALSSAVSQGRLDPNDVAEPYKARLKQLGIVKEQYTDDQIAEINQLQTAIADPSWYGNLRPEARAVLEGKANERIHEIMSQPRLVMNEPPPPSWDDLVKSNQIIVPPGGDPLDHYMTAHKNAQGQWEYQDHFPGRGKQKGEGDDSLKQQEFERKQYEDQMKDQRQREKDERDNARDDRKLAMDLAKAEAGTDNTADIPKLFQKHWADTPSGQLEAQRKADAQAKLAGPPAPPPPKPRGAPEGATEQDAELGASIQSGQLSDAKIAAMNPAKLRAAVPRVSEDNPVAPGQAGIEFLDDGSEVLFRALPNGKHRVLSVLSPPMPSRARSPLLPGAQPTHYSR